MFNILKTGFLGCALFLVIPIAHANSWNPIPAATLTSGSDTLCSGEKDTLLVNLSGGGPYTLVYSINNINQAPIVTSLAMLPLIIMPPAGQHTVRLVSVSNASGSGMVSGQFIYLVKAIPAGTFPADTTVCSGDTTQLRLNFTGTAPFIYNYSVAGVPQGPDTVLTNQAVLLIAPFTNTSYSLTSLSGGGCVGTANDMVVVTVPPPVSAEVSGGGQICQNGSGTQIIFTFQGPGPYTFVYTTNNTARPPVTTSLNPYILSVNPVVGTFYRLQSVTNSGICFGEVSGQAVAFVFSPPTANMSGGGTFCNVANTGVTVDFTGTGPFTITYTANGVAQPPLTTFDDPYFLPIAATVTTTYQLTSTESPGCTGTSTGSATVTVNHTPAYTNLTTTCNPAGLAYQVEFDVLNGTPPYTLITGAGVFTGNHFLSTPLPGMQNYNFVFRDAINCGNATVSGVSGCVCTTNAGTMSPATVEACQTDTVTVPAATGTTLDANDVLLYALHTNPALPLGMVLAWNGQPQFAFQSGMQTETPYYISAVAGNPGANGQVDQSDICLSVATGTPVIFHTTPTGTLATLDTNICLGETVLLPVTFTGTPPFSFVYALSGVNQLPVGNINGNTYNLMLTPLQSSTVQLVGISDQYCANGSTGGQATINVQATPTGLLPALDTSICLGESVTLPFTFTGTPPFSFVYAVSGVDQPPISILDSSTYDVALTPLQSINVQLVSVSDRYCATGTVSGQALVSVHDVPQLGNSTVACDFANLTYTLSFDVQNGNAPYDLSGVSGTFNGSTFTSTNYPFGEPYFIYFRDTFDCGVDTLIGVPPCACTSDAGTMSDTALLKFCRSATAVASHAGNDTLDSDDVRVFVLHTSATDSLGMILATNSTPSFNFLPGLVLGTTYYISAVVGNSDGAGGVQPTDPCLSVAPGTPVVWNAEPTGTITGTYDVCQGVPQGITVIFLGQAPFQFVYTSNGQAMNSTATQTVFNIVANLQQTTTFALTSVQDANCPGTVSGQAVLTVHQVPEIANPVITCAADNETYTVEFDVLNSNSATVTGTVPGNLEVMTGHFTSLPVPIQQLYTFQAVDTQFNCGGDTISGAPVCPCVTDAGSLSQSPLFPCLGDMVTTLAATNFTLDGNDTLLYYLTTMPNPPTWTVLGISSTPVFGYDSTTMTLGTTYYIVGLAGNSLGGNIDLNDPCLSFATGPAVVWQVPPTATLSGTTAVCPGALAELAVQFTGTGPFDFSYYIDGIPQNAISATNNFTLTVQPTDSTAYGLISVTDDAGCLGTVSGTATVALHAIPTATLAGDTTLCQGGSTAFQIQFTGTAPYELVYALNGAPQATINALTNPFFISTGNVQMPQTFTLLSVKDAYCPGPVSGMATVQVNPAPTGSIQQDITICTGDSTLLTLQLSGGAIYDVTVSGGPSPIQLDSVANGVAFLVRPAATTTYAITSLVTTGNSCPVIIGQAAAVTVTSLSATATVSDYSGFDVSCPNATDGSIIVTPTGGTAPLTASWSNGAIGLELTDVPAGTYSLLLTDQTGCVFRDSFVLTGPPDLLVDFHTQAPPCFDDREGALVLDSIQGGVQPYTFSINGQTSQVVDSLPLVIPSLAAGAYQLSVEDANGCRIEEVFSITSPLPLQVDLGPDVTISFGDSTLLEAEVNSNIIQSFQWTPADYLQQPQEQLTWARPPETQAYAVQVTDTMGCTASDRILVTVQKEERVYIPNIIYLHSDSYNHILTISTGPEVQNIRSLRVYDRWGGCLYEGLDLPTNDAQFGWPGTYKGKNVTPGVYVYTLEVQYIDGTLEVFYGDVTVVD